MHSAPYKCRTKRARACIVASLLLGLLPASVAAQTTSRIHSPQLCWAPTSLLVKAGEEQIRKNVRQAFITPPNASSFPSSPVPPEQRGSIRSVKLPPGKKLIALTFDLCEQPYEVAGYQGGIVDYLRKEGIKATFFAGGKWMLTHRDRTQQLMSDPLFEVANHTWEHRNLRLLSGPALAEEIQRTEVAYEQVRSELEARQCIGRDIRTFAHERAPRTLNLFRFPFGACDAKSLKAVADAGLLAIQWNVSSGDPWFGQSSEQMIRAVLNEVHPGSIVLFHANGRGWHTGSALPAIITGLRSQGYEFVTVSELLRAGEPVYASTCYDSRPGDTDRYDELARRLEVMFQRARELVMSRGTTLEDGAGPRLGTAGASEPPNLPAISQRSDHAEAKQVMPLPKPRVHQLKEF